MNYRTSSIGLKLDKLLNPTHEDFIHWAYFDGGGYFPGSDEYDLAADKFMRFFKTKTAPVPGWNLIRIHCRDRKAMITCTGINAVLLNIREVLEETLEQASLHSLITKAKPKQYRIRSC